MTSISHRDDDLDYAFVSDTEIGGLRSVFVRLVPVATAHPETTIDIEDGSVDLDATGRLIGINLVWKSS